MRIQTAIMIIVWMMERVHIVVNVNPNVLRIFQHQNVSHALRVRLRPAGALRALTVCPRAAARGLPARPARVPLAPLENTRRRVVVRLARRAEQEHTRI
jgi:hypothetical protein